MEKTNPANPVAGKVVYQFIPLFPGFFFYTSKTVVNRLGISELLLMERNPAPPGMYKTL